MNKPDVSEQPFTVLPEDADFKLIAAGPPLWRLQLVRALQIIGVSLGVIGGADVLNLVSILSPDVAKWLTVSGPALFAASKPVIMMIGDYLDDGIKNDSFKIQ